MKEKERQAQAAHQEKFFLPHSHPVKTDVTEIEIQGVERRGCSFPAWVAMKSHIVESNSIRVTTWVLRTWEGRCITDVT